MLWFTFPRNKIKAINDATHVCCFIKVKIPGSEARFYEIGQRKYFKTALLILQACKLFLREITDGSRVSEKDTGLIFRATLRTG